MVAAERAATVDKIRAEAEVIDREREARRSEALADAVDPEKE